MNRHYYPEIDNALHRVQTEDIDMRWRVEVMETKPTPAGLQNHRQAAALGRGLS